MKRCKTTDDTGVSLSDILRRIERLEWAVLGVPEGTSSTTSDVKLTAAGREARIARDRVQSIQAQNDRFWKETA